MQILSKLVAKPLDLRCRFCYLYTCPPQYVETNNLKGIKFIRLFLFLEVDTISLTY